MGWNTLGSVSAEVTNSLKTLLHNGKFAEERIEKVMNEGALIL